MKNQGRDDELKDIMAIGRQISDFSKKFLDKSEQLLEEAKKSKEYIDPERLDENYNALFDIHQRLGEIRFVLELPVYKRAQEAGLREELDKSMRYITSHLNHLVELSISYELNKEF